MTLESAFESLTITESKCLPFNLAVGGLLTELECNEAYRVVPQYLFRVISPKSQGKNTADWQRSHDAARLQSDGTVDIFAMEKHTAAAMLNRHLRWWDPKHGDNLVSWTSSQLFAVQYIIYLRNKFNIDLRDIKLCVIDTQYFSPGVFLRDLELIQAFRSFDSNLDSLAGLRRRKHRISSGYFYFGEYLSQGSLRVSHTCQLVDASALVDNGLYNLRPQLQDTERQDSSEWANRVIFLREEFYSTLFPVETTEQELRAAVSIAQLFEPRWRLPVASSLLALRPRNWDDSRILYALNPQHLKYEEGKVVEDPRLRTTGVSHKDIMDFAYEAKFVSHEYLPEVAQVQHILEALRVDCTASRLMNNVRYARRCVRLLRHEDGEVPRYRSQSDILICRTTLQEKRYKRVRSYISSLKLELSRLEEALPEGLEGASSPDESDWDDHVSDPY